MLGSKTKERTTQETQGLYWFGPPFWCNTLLQCVVWWIASWADDDEQYKEEQPHEGLFLAEAMNCWEEFSHLSLSLSLSRPTEPEPQTEPPCYVGGWSYL